MIGYTEEGIWERSFIKNQANTLSHAEPNNNSAMQRLKRRIVSAERKTRDDPMPSAAQHPRHGMATRKNAIDKYSV
jgi:hypothetical protein